MDPRLRGAALALALLAAPAWGQRQPKTLHPGRGKIQLAFADMMKAHVERTLGGTGPLTPMRGAEPIEPAVYVTITPARVMLWDQDVLALTTTGAPQRADLASCPPACLPRLRDAAQRAIAAEEARLRRAGEKTAPRVLLIADGRVPHATFLAVAYSIANATAGGPPDMRLAVRAGQAMGQVPLLLAPPHPIKIGQNANPINLHLSLEGRRIIVAARKSWLPWPEQSASIGAVVRLIGELKARDTNKTVVFITAPPSLPLSRVLELVSPVRELFPNFVLGDMPAIQGPAE